MAADEIEAACATLTPYEIRQVDFPAQETVVPGKEPIIVTRHAGLVAWLNARGITGRVYNRITDAAAVRGRVVYGNLPVYLAAQAEYLIFAVIPGLMPGGGELSDAALNASGAYLIACQVREVVS